MCGITGYIGQRSAWEMVLGGLKRLEYRGYDSAGIVTVAEGEMRIARRVGHIRALEESTPHGLPGHVGVGHTRWATHGGVTEANCHPHRDSTNRIALVHNGIIDNVEALRRELVAAGVQFRSETDTEVLAELIGRALGKGVSLLDAVISSLTRIEGTAGIVVLDRQQPDRLVAARIGSPVVIGVGEGETWVASDVLALRPYTERVVVLEDGEVAELTAREFKTVGLDSRDREKRVEKILHQAEAAELGDYAHYMLKEINEQPEAIDRSMRGRLDAAMGSSHLGGLSSHRSRLFDIQRVVFFGCGTSLYSAEVGAYLMSLYARVPAQAQDAAELAVQNPIVDNKTLYVAISQSGETADTLSALREIKLKGGLIAGVTNVVGSSLARETDFGTYVHAGPEISVCSTKAFTAQVLATELLALQFARMRDLSATDGRVWVKALEQMPRQVRGMLEQAPKVRRVAERFGASKFTMFIGRGANVAVAREGALKLKEIAYVPAEGLSGAAMKHGPLALIEPGLPVWALVPPDETRERMLGNLRELKARGAVIIAVADAGDSEVSQLVDEVIQLPPHHPAVSPMLTVVPLQLYAYFVALALGYDIDKPRNLAKSVTVL
ncbi:MAG TPA: glutamine--fructose-6-phosphate transaminase (isomerizing) [Polyangiaceae bacterium]|nr:glutamine--fructose-6-phosphate transaminase (isomerizing) [Polyangiaceae bacterium]